MGFRPLHDRVVIRRVESEEKSAGGIIIPDTALQDASSVAGPLVTTKALVVDGPKKDTPALPGGGLDF